MSGLSKLVEIDRAELPQLRDMYLADWPENMLGYYTVDNFIRCFEKDPEIKSLVFYCLDGDWSDGSFAVIVNHLHHNRGSEHIEYPSHFLGSLPIVFE